MTSNKKNQNVFEDELQRMLNGDDLILKN